MSARPWRMAVSITILAATASSAAAQGYGVVQQPQQKKQDISGKGEFDANVQGDVLKAQIDGRTWFIKLDPKASVKVTGSAAPEALAPGMFVSFKGDFDKRGKAAEEVKDLEIFSPDAKNPIEAVPAGGAFGGGAFDEQPKKTAPKTPATTPTSLSIVGRITVVKKNNITVACGNMTVRADVASDATIAVNAGTMMLASPQDKVSVKGWYYPSSGPTQNKPGMMIANEVEVQMAKPLTGPKKKAVRTVAKPAADKADPLAIGDKKTDADKNAATDKKTADKKPADKPDDAATDKKPDAAGAKPDPAAPDAKKPADDPK